MWNESPKRMNPFLFLVSTWLTDTPQNIGFSPAMLAFRGWAPVATAPTPTASTALSLAIFWPHCWPCSSDVEMKHVCSFTGCPSMPPAYLLT